MTPELKIWLERLLERAEEAREIMKTNSDSEISQIGILHYILGYIESAKVLLEKEK